MANHLTAVEGWLRRANPPIAEAPSSPAAMAAVIAAAPPQRAARLLLHTLLRQRPACPEAAPWLRAAGLAAWQAAVRICHAADPAVRDMAEGRLGRLVVYDAGRVFDRVGDDMSIGLRLDDIAAMEAVPGALDGPLPAVVGGVLQRHIAELHADLGPNPGRHARVPLRSALAVTVLDERLTITAPDLPAVELVAAATHWEVHSQGRCLGTAPPCALLRIARIVTQHWSHCWLSSTAWLPTGCNGGRSLSADVLNRLALSLGPLALRMGERGTCGIWTRTVAARLRPHLQPLATRQFTPRIREVWQRLAAAAPFPLHSNGLGIVVDPRFWAHRWLTADVLRLRGAATVVRSLCAQGLMDDAATAEYQATVERLLAEGWMAVCTAEGSVPNRPLRVSLSKCPGGLPLVGWPLTRLARIVLLRPRTTRLEMLAALAVTRLRQLNDADARMLLTAGDQELRCALRHDVAGGRLPNLRSGVRICQCIQDWLDYPEGAASVLQLSQRSAIWHEQQRIGDLFGPEVDAKPEPYPPATALAPLPVSLPREPAPGISLRVLTTVGELGAEGAEMQHCVASYVEAARAGQCFILHLEVQGVPATVELDPHLRVVQARGPRNKDNAASRWATAHFAGLLTHAAGVRA